MKSNTWLMVLLIMGFIQMLVIMWVSARHKTILNKYPANAYGKAVQELCKQYPMAGNLLRACYLGFILEVLFFVLVK